MGELLNSLLFKKAADFLYKNSISPSETLEIASILGISRNEVDGCRIGLSQVGNTEVTNRIQRLKEELAGIGELNFKWYVKSFAKAYGDQLSALASRAADSE